MASNRITYVFTAKDDGVKRTAQETGASLDALAKKAENFTTKLKNADFTPYDSALKRLQRGQFGEVDSGVSSSMAKTRAEMALTGREAVQLSYQLNDIFVSLAGGQKPLMVMVQQGSQITQIFGGIGGTIARLTPLLLKWTLPLAAAGTAAAALYGIIKAPDWGKEAAKGIADIGDAADRAKVSGDRFQAVMKAISKAGGTPASEVQNAAETAINTLRDLISSSKKSQQEATKGKPQFAKRLSVPGAGEDPFEKVAGLQSGKQYKTVKPAFIEGQTPPSTSPEISAKIGKQFPGAEDVVSKLGVDVRDLNNSLPDTIKLLERLAKSFSLVTDEAKRVDLSRELDKALKQPLSKLVQNNDLEGIKKALVGQIDQSGIIPESKLRQSQKIQNQVQDNEFNQQFGDLSKKRVLLPAAEASVQKEAGKIAKDAATEGVMDRLTNILGNFVDTLQAIESGNKQAKEQNPMTSGVVSFGQSVNDMVSAGASKIGDLIMSGLEAITPKVNETKSGMDGAAQSAKTFADETGRAADNMERAARASKDVQAPSAEKAAGFASGGYIRGPGTSRSDSILAWLSNGEYVVNAATVAALGAGSLHALNAGAHPAEAFGFSAAPISAPGFTDGGFVGGYSPAGGLAAVAGSSSASNGNNVTIVLDNRAHGPFSGSGADIDALSRAAAGMRAARTAKTPSRVG